MHMPFYIYKLIHLVWAGNFAWLDVTLFDLFMQFLI